MVNGAANKEWNLYFLSSIDGGVSNLAAIGADRCGAKAPFYGVLGYQ